MATNAKNGSKMSAKQRQARKKTKLIIFGVEVVIIAVMMVVLLWVWKPWDSDSEGGGIAITELDRGESGISPEADKETQEGGSMHGYINIALFGVDAQNRSQLFKSSRSDSIMVASINLDTGKIKLVSIYRDTYLYYKWPIYKKNKDGSLVKDEDGNPIITGYNERYDKCNGAYARGGPQYAVHMLNTNLDLNIEHFITIGYAGLAKVIDGLGGVWIDVDKDELKHINNYQYSILGKLAKSKYNINISQELNFTPDDYFQDYEVKLVEKEGYQLLNGLQATAYCRIRYAGNNDFQRTARQREVIKAIEEQAKKADLATLIKVFQDVVGGKDPYIGIGSVKDEDTDEKDILKNMIFELLPNIANYEIIDEAGFPELKQQIGVNMGAKGSCQIPLDLPASVSGLHGFLFGDENYETSATVKQISQQILEDASRYRKSD